MAIVNKEYLFSINQFNEPDKVTGQKAIGLLLARLIMMDPGSDPLHPTMGVGIRKYRYAVDHLNELKKRIQDQIETFLPEYQNVTVNIRITRKKTCNIEISINDVVYVYDSDTAPIPITLDSIENN